MIVLYLAPFVSPQSSYLLALLALAYPFLLILHILLIIWWLYWRSRAVYLSLFTIVLGISHFFNFVGIAGGVATGKGGFKLMTYNVHYFNSLGVKNSVQAAPLQKAVTDYIVQQKPDIFCAQEFSGRTSDLTLAARNAMVQGAGLVHEYRGGGSSLAIYSRFPIVGSGTLTFGSSYNAVIFTDLQMPSNRIVRVYNMHLQSVKLGADSDEVLNKHNLTHLNSDETKEKYRRISSKLHRAFVMRADQSEILAAHIKKSPYPVVLAGDLNDTPQSYCYRRVSAGLQDSFWECGWGLGTTYAGNLPFLRIDYAFASPHFRIYNHHVLSQPYSDHYPVVVGLGLVG